MVVFLPPVGQAADMLPPPTLQGLCGNEIIVEHSPNFDWSSVGSADTYRIRVSTDAGFPGFNEKSADSSCSGNGCWTAVTGSPGYSGFNLPSGVYYWQARAGIKYKNEDNKGKSGKWSSTCQFEINDLPVLVGGSMVPVKESNLTEVGDGASVRFTCVWTDSENNHLFNPKVRYGDTEIEFKPPKNPDSPYSLTIVEEINSNQHSNSL